MVLNQELDSPRISCQQCLDTFLVALTERGGDYYVQWIEFVDAETHPAIYRSPHQKKKKKKKDLSGINVNIAKVEKSCSSPPVKPEVHNHALSLREDQIVSRHCLKLFNSFPLLVQRLKTK